MREEQQANDQGNGAGAQDPSADTVCAVRECAEGR